MENENDIQQDYIETIDEMRKNSVPKDTYEKLREENKRLLASLRDGVQPEQEKVEEERSLDDIRKNLFDNPNITNLDYWKDTLELRERIKAEEGRDIFVPHATEQYQPALSDYQTAEKVASIVQECIDYAEGDAAVFQSELMRRTNGKI